MGSHRCRGGGPLHSRELPQVVSGRPYFNGSSTEVDAPEIHRILTHRAHKGLKNHNPSMLNEIAALTANQATSDVRIAIRTLFNTITQPHKTIKQCFEAARRDIYHDLLQGLNDKCLLILRATQLTREPFVKNIHHTYTQLSQHHGETPFSYVHFYSHLGYLQSMGLLILTSAKINRAYTNRVNILCNERTLNQTFKTRVR